MKKKNFAYETYKDVEVPENFSSAQELAAYRAALLRRARKKELPFFRKFFPRGLGKTLEIGSGNGRILYTLEQEKLLTEGLGIEISPSRTAFAEAWKKELGSKNVRTICDDMLTADITEKFDTALCLTSIFPFFDMFQKNGLAKMLAKTHRLLNPGGTVVLESVTFREEIACARAYGGSVNLWAEFKESDPFQFNLVTYRWNEKRRELSATTWNTMRHKLQTDGPTKKMWHMETADEIQKKLQGAGFEKIKVFGGHDGKPYRTHSLAYLFVATKPKK